MAKTLKADCIIEVPIRPQQFPDLSPVMNAREVEERLLVAKLKQLVADIERSGVRCCSNPATTKRPTSCTGRPRRRIIEGVGSLA